MQALIDSLKSSHPGQTHTPHDEPYFESLGSYWSNQAAEIRPAMILRPKTSGDLASMIKLLADANISSNFAFPFAIRSGGHMSWGGAANIKGGAVVDLRALDSIVINKAVQRVVVGSGCYWSALYEKVEAEGLMVPGARVTNCGVAGFCLGGGISYFSPRMGFMCDNVVAFEIVLADGSIAEANAEENPDLYRALKGGANNFGIVTSFRMRTFDWPGTLWGGGVVYGFDKIPQQLESLNRAVNGKAYDVNVALIVTCGFHHEYAAMGPLGYNSLKYTQPVEGNPEFLKPFADISGSFHNSMRRASLKELLDEEGQSQGRGLRRLFMNVSFVCDLHMLQRSIALWKEAVAKLQDVEGIIHTIMFNPITTNGIKRSIELGGNALGLTPEKPLIICAIAATWNTAESDAKVVSTTKEMLAQINDEASEREVNHPYIYMNYAWEGQRVVDGYGPESKKDLLRISQKYDPHGVFQKAVPGGFKLDPSQM